MPIATSPNKFETERHDVVTVNVGSPAPGAACFWPVPANLVIHIVGIQFRVLTSVAAGNRWPLVFLFHPIDAFVMHRFPVMQLQLPNTDMNYSMVSRWPFLALTPTVAVRMGPLGRFLILKPPEQLVIFCENMDVGDRIQNIRIRYHEWKED